MSQTERLAAPTPETVGLTPDFGENSLELLLTDEEQQTVDTFAEKIDLKNTYIVLQYGAAAQRKIAGFSDTALNGVRSKETGQIGAMISQLLEELRTFSVEEKGVIRFFLSAGKKMERLKNRYDEAESNVDHITGILEQHQNQLLTDIVMLERLYQTNQSYLKELTMYILAGKKRLEQERSSTLLQLREKAQASGLAEDAQAADDFASVCDRFEKKLYDLELTRMISIQMSPQIRLVQNSNTLMAEKIQSTINNTIPLWKNQMVLALGMAHTKEALEAQRKVNQTTNHLLRQNAETLRSETIEIARESERGIVDLETIRHTNEQLLSTLDEVLAIQQDGRRKRLEAENEMIRIEEQLKRKLLDFQS